MPEIWTVLAVLDWTRGRFERAGIDAPRLDAQILLAHVLGCDRIALYTQFDKPLADDELGRYRELIRRRLAGEPVAYLVGEREFWSLDFAVDRRVLVPRPDTETLVQLVVELCGKDGAPRIADVGTGSGAIAVSLAHEIPGAEVVAVDVSTDALEVARGNAERNAVADRIDFRHGDLLGPLAGERFDVLAANLPYVRSADMATLSADVQSEPRLALDGGADGLDPIRKLVAGAADHLAPGGAVVLEHGADQGEAVADLARAAGAAAVETRADLAGRARVTWYRLPATA